MRSPCKHDVLRTIFLTYTHVKAPPAKLFQVESCWNFRFVQEEAARRGTTPPWALPFREMQPSALQKLLPVARSTYGEGCNNEVTRVMSSNLLSEGALGRLTTNGSLHRGVHAPRRVLSDVLDQLSHCAAPYSK